VADGGKEVEVMGGLGVLATIGAFAAGAFLLVPLLRAWEYGSFPIVWVIAAGLLLVAAVALGNALDFAVRAFMSGYRKSGER